MSLCQCLVPTVKVLKSYLHQGPHLVKKQAEYVQADYMKDVKTHKPFNP